MGKAILWFLFLGNSCIEFEKYDTTDYDADMTPHAISRSFGASLQRWRGCTCVKLSPSGIYFFYFLPSSASWGLPAGPGSITAVNGSNDESGSELHNLYSLDYDSL